MELPNIPSDTIYKFSTVLGLILVIFSLFHLYDRLDEIYDKKENDFKKRVSTLINQSYLINEIEELTSIIDTISYKVIIKKDKLTTSGKSNIYAPKFLHLSDSLFLFKYYLKSEYSIDSSLIAITDSLNKKIRHYEKVRWELLIERNIVEYEAYNNKFRQLIIIITSLVGIFMMIWGFITWKRKELKFKKKKK